VPTLSQVCEKSWRLIRIMSMQSCLTSKITSKTVISLTLWEKSVVLCNGNNIAQVQVQNWMSLIWANIMELWSVIALDTKIRSFDLIPYRSIREFSYFDLIWRVFYGVTVDFPNFTTRPKNSVKFFSHLTCNLNNFCVNNRPNCNIIHNNSLIQCSSV
jgi:hypothetical protein